jgi:hypothetical protein
VIQATEGKVKISHDRYETSTPVCQPTTPTLKIPIATTKVSDAGIGFAGILTIGRKLVSSDRSSYRRNEGGFEELNVSAKSEKEQGQMRICLVYYMQDGREPQE